MRKGQAKEGLTMLLELRALSKKHSVARRVFFSIQILRDILNIFENDTFLLDRTLKIWKKIAERQKILSYYSVLIKWHFLYFNSQNLIISEQMLNFYVYRDNLKIN